MAPIGRTLTIQGVVQGVGFRPYVYLLARRYRLGGRVANTGEGVSVQVEGPPSSVRAFTEALLREAPRLSRITALDERPSEVTGLEDFLIEESLAGPGQALIPADVATCPDCLSELRDPADRRFGYPFINCTNCGPRYTLIETLPYDRDRTSMRVFPMCPACAEDYKNPANRRFHAEPNACPVCGPSLWLLRPDGTAIPDSDPLAEAARLLARGGILAVKGLGGFHLAVDARSEAAVSALRARKRRPAKPLAIMAADMDRIRDLFDLEDGEAEGLESPEAPILLLRPRAESGLASGLSPGIQRVGVMLPYTPLHHRLFDQPETPPALVMTSGNLTGWPICTDNDAALRDLGGIAELFVVHNRPIVSRVDDSVARVHDGVPRMIRRSRGYVPRPLTLPWELPPGLACGAELKNTFCLNRGRTAFLSQHVGDLENAEVLDFYQETVTHLTRLLGITPSFVAHDLHPDYLSSRYAADQGLPAIAVQHHHAHAVAVMAEHGIEGPALALILDGAGYGPDGTVWGGELLWATPTAFRRLGRLEHLRLPGGDVAAREPWRMGLSALWNTLGPHGLEERALPEALRSVPAAKRAFLAGMLEKNVNSPATSSCGRLFDAVAALLGVTLENHYEGQAAMALEGLAEQAACGEREVGYEARRNETDGLAIVNHAPLVEGILQDLRLGVPREVIALRFHLWLLEAWSRLVEDLAAQTGLRTVVLGGGCLQNGLLLKGFLERFRARGLDVHAAREVPTNDGGLSLGQLVIGGLRHVSRHPHAGH